MANKREVSHKYLQGEIKYDYCPWCVQKMEQEGINWKERLKPLKFVTTAEPIKREDGTYWDYFDTHYECSNCNAMNINVNTFMVVYCMRYDGTKFNEPRKEPGLVWSKEKDCLVPAKWNQVQKKWEEITDKTLKE